MTNHLIKFAGICALSAVTVAGVSLFATNALAAEADEDDDVAITADDDAAITADDDVAITADDDVDVDNDAVDNDAVNIDEDTTAESNDAIINRGWYRYPGFYHRWPGYRLYSRPYYYRNYYRYYYPRPVPYYRSPFYGAPTCGPWGCFR